jgi:hypothetical protein
MCVVLSFFLFFLFFGAIVWLHTDMTETVCIRKITTTDLHLDDDDDDDVTD